MLLNPFLPSPSRANAWAEGFTKAIAATASPSPSDGISPEDMDAFNAGVGAGEEAGNSGIVLGDPCIPGLDEHGPLHSTSVVIDGVDIAHGVWETVHLGKLAAGIGAIVVSLVELACTLPVHTLPPDCALSDETQPMVDQLVGMGIESMALFCGAGMDPSATDCEIRLTPLFKSLDQARQAAIAMNRNNWVVATWRTDQSGSLSIVDSGTR